MPGTARLRFYNQIPEGPHLPLPDNAGSYPNPLALSLAQVCRDLAHLYHYYLHGERGNRTPSIGDGPASPPTLPGGEPLPRIIVSFVADGRAVWRHELAEITDDLETLYLRAQQSEMTFLLNVPGKGTVSGVLFYFPFQNDRDTLPAEDHPMAHRPVSMFNMTQVSPAFWPSLWSKDDGLVVAQLSTTGQIHITL